MMLDLPGVEPLRSRFPSEVPRVVFGGEVLDVPEADSRVRASFLESADGGSVLVLTAPGRIEVRRDFAHESCRWPNPTGMVDPAGWDGDRYGLYETPDGGRSLVWVSVWDDVGSRDRFVAALRPALGGLPATAILRSTAIDGRPAAVLEIGAPPATRATLNGGAEE